MTSLCAEIFLSSPDILTHVVKHLSRHEAVKIRAVCRALRSTVEMLIKNNVAFRPRLLVVASETNKLIELDPSTGDALRCVPIRKTAKRASMIQWWPTIVALCPWNGDFYVCQYAGRSVRRFNGDTLAYMRIAAELPQGMSAPEGLCFSKHCMFVASADAGSVVRFHWDSSTGDFAPADGIVQIQDLKINTRRWDLPEQLGAVPWTMITGPDGNLFVAVDIEYDELSEHLPTLGVVMTMALDSEGKFMEVEPEVFAAGAMRRPSGLSFDSDGNLFVTSITNEVLLFKGPLSDSPGELLRVAVAWDDREPQGLGALHPWDVAWCPGVTGIGTGPLLFVTRHSAVRGKCKSRISVYCAASGACLRELACPLFRQANMLAFA